MPEIEGVVTPVVATVAPTTVTVADLPPEALKQRLEQAAHAAQTKLLADLGIANVDEAKAAIAAQKAAAEAAKTDAEKLAALNLRVTAQAEALTVAVSQAASKITSEQKAAVDAIAGADAVAWLKTYAALAPTWGAAPAATVADTPITAPAAAPILASTAPAAPAPAPTTQTSQPDHAAIYSSLQTTNRFAAAQYLQQHGSACYPKT
jgi:hypothetical protein